MGLARRFGFALGLLPFACTPPAALSRTGQARATPAAAEALAAPSEAEIEREWHTWTPPGEEGLYKVVELNLTAPSVPEGACSPELHPGITFLMCSRPVRVDGARLDLAFPSPGLAFAFEGTFPGDFWARVSGEASPDGLAASPPADPFVARTHVWKRWDGAGWEELPSGADERAPWLGGSALLRLPPRPTATSTAIDGDGARPECADHACAEIVPEVLVHAPPGAATAKPDFAALRGKVAWLHGPCDADHTSRAGCGDYRFAVDPAGPIYLAMRAYEKKTRRRGFGLARWTPAGGATFEWLPAPHDSEREIVFGSMVASAGRLVLPLLRPRDNTRFVLEHDGSIWSARVGTVPPAPAARPRPTPLPLASEYELLPEGGLVRHLPNGETHAVVSLSGTSAESKVVAITVAEPNDVWVMTLGGTYRTVPPPETLYRTEYRGALHPWPPRAKADCDHPFVIVDATAIARADELRNGEWAHLDDPRLVELEVGGQLVVGIPAKSMAEAAEIKISLPSRFREGVFQGPVCARPLRPRPFRSQPAE